ncbi:AAA-like domain-containing protein [Leptolyngbya sp. FACHB-17]|uniref:AAA-like domain-containing protein n=1 Tax=unclassified Leptolyngbya TaxID=2650499 RepID=UPI0016809282|nr:AAA-like domain-containing protein [Leptolyngbya sp. FACHB-17]MBD2081160.1 AAA-like domain-containing protein [Leptolyngbya sp. FACHB-17]
MSNAPSPRQPAKRKRGVILSARGWQRLQAAEARFNQQQHSGKPYTLQELSDRTELSPNTLARVRSRKVAVDQHTLENYFRAFDLRLSPEDYTDADSPPFNRQSLLANGQLPIDSPFYVYRPPIEALCYEALMQPGALVRVKAPRQMGKTSLVSRVLTQLREQHYHTAIISLQLADASVLTDLRRFLQWFCAIVSQNFGLHNHLDRHWDDLFGNSYNCTNYFENYILTEITEPIVLALDEVDAVFEHPEIAADFFGMLRAWYEKSRYGDAKSELWQKLRLVLIHSIEVYVPLHLNQSPFNAGLLVELPTLNAEQVLDLAQRYGFEDLETAAEALLNLTGGNPYLVQVGLHHLSLQSVSIEELLRSTTSDGVYGNHLRNLLWDLQKYPELMAALRRVVFSDAPVEVEPLQAFKLQSKGLVRMKNSLISPSCELYRQFFQQALSTL